MPKNTTAKVTDDKGTQWKKFVGVLREAEGEQLVVGFPEGKVPREVILRAIANEFGVPSQNIPARRFMRLAFERRNRSWAIDGGKNFVNTLLRQKKSLQPVWKDLGPAFARDIRQAIIDLDKPANAPSTVDRKGFDDPLIETGEMRDSVTWAIEGK